ncbi:PREDICTED: protein asteroid homolog 1-like [Amphimedon queenslandica]|uniref:Asteroid domain-containing protein n=1 Tax=Amphimedon queenslandica TaxID=400682 RepID=A0A1X7U9F8_AMPQE|nr:PREDICTED: protein asteroid homolog 1-like [Amphimedon queenslandica]|eukprot:XP_011405724.1 PREDICTED: protein asteroid homolog 1-like [Amphimedon queenslandica]
MGIRGLTTYMLEKSHLEVVCEAYSLKGKTLVLDGLSVCYTLIEQEEKINWVQGGQYWDIKSCFHSFFTKLRESGIKSYVVIDGVPPQSKGEELERRSKDKMKRISQGVREPYRLRTTCHPLHTDYIFCEVLKEFGDCVQVIFADGEADPEIASLANHYHCPVLAYDSDYFIFNLDEGYIPLHPELFKWKTNEEIEAKQYLLPKFKKEFKDPALVFLIPAIIENDFIKLPRGGESVEQLMKSQKICSSLEEFLTHRTQEEVPIIRQNYVKAKAMYHITPVSKEELMSNTKLNTANGKPLRGTHIIEEYHKGNLAESVLTVITQGECELPMMIDDPEQASSVLIGREIRKSIYRIVAPCLPEDENGVKKVKEIYRNASCDGLEMKFVELSKDECLRSCPIDEIPQLRPERKIEILCTAVEVDLRKLKQFEDEWKLIALSLHYWARHADPSDHLIKALILCFSVCTLCGRDPTIYIDKRNEIEKERAQVTWRENLHIFAQWKCVYDNIFDLNSLLINPLPFKSFASLFNGELLMHYTKLSVRAFEEEIRRWKNEGNCKSWFEPLFRFCQCTKSKTL